MAQLGERVVAEPHRVSRLVDELAEAGLVTREPNPDDRRSAFAVLTSDGRRRFSPRLASTCPPSSASSRPSIRRGWPPRRRAEAALVDRVP